MTAPVPAGPTDAQAELREALATVLRAHGLISSGRVNGTMDCRCRWSGPYLSRHQADAILALPAVRDALAAQETVKRVETFADVVQRDAAAYLTDPPTVHALSQCMDALRVVLRGKR